jgi:DNA-binding beta-propeller fold protein YncE
LTGSYLGIFARPIQPTGIIFDDAGNLYVCSDNDPESSILKFTPDGTGSVFANSGLDGPHGLAFDDAGNLYVENRRTIQLSNLIRMESAAFSQIERMV